MVRTLRRSRWFAVRNRGGHEVWSCPCGRHSTALPNHRQISAGVVSSIERQMEACR